MLQKHRIHTTVGGDKRVNLTLEQRFDVMEILSLKFTDKDIYSSENCSRYGVVVGRITTNNGYGIPNARVSIFIPQSENDMDDPVINSLYPYRTVYDRNDNGYRYNLLPREKQHGGHTPTGTFMSQEDVLSREENLLVFENYYTFTVKTNESGDFMIWGVPVGLQTIHVDIDLSDIGCFSLRPYDFIRKGRGVEEFDRVYRFKSSEDIDGLPQIITFDKPIEVYPFWGNDDLCDVSITRTDFDLGERGVRIDPVATILLSSVMDDSRDAIKRNGKIKKNAGFKCNLQTTSGTVECVRYTGNYVYGSDGVTKYPELKYLTIPEVMDENGALMALLPMNMDYMYTDEYGEVVYTNDKSKGIPTTSTARFRVGLDFSDGKKTTAKYLIPNIREFNPNITGVNDRDEYSHSLLSTYQFSDVFEDYINYLPPSGVTLNTTSYGDDVKTHKKNLMLGVDNNGIPEDYFYKFVYGKVYTVSSFQGTKFESNRRDAFLGFKQIRPSEDEDCASETNYIPTNYGYKNRTNISLILSQAQLFLQFVISLVILSVGEMLARFTNQASNVFINIGIRNWRPFRKFSELLQDLTYKIQDRFTQQLVLTIYPDCEECVVDDQDMGIDLSYSNNYCSLAEYQAEVLFDGEYAYLGSADRFDYLSFKNKDTDKSFVLDGEYVRDTEGGCTGTTQLDYVDLTTLHNSVITPEEGDNNNHRYYGEVYPWTKKSLTGATLFSEFIVFFTNKSDYPEDRKFQNGTVLGAERTYMRMTREEWNYLSGMDTSVTQEEIDGLYAVIRIYDRGVQKKPVPTRDGDTSNEVTLESGCARYDTIYNETIARNYLWSKTEDYGSPIEPLIPTDGEYYGGNYCESKKQPSGYTHLLATVIGGSNTYRLPYRAIWKRIPNARYDRKTKSGLSEFRDGVFTIIPVARGGSKNITAIWEWYQRKKINLFFCGGVVNYSFVDNWLHGILYFFKFDRRVRWDDRNVWDLNKRRTKYPRDLIFYNLFENTFYYRSCPYQYTNGNGVFIGQSNKGNKEILHPTTFYDVGVRDEFLYEICVDRRVDPTCSVVRDISPTSYQDPGNIMEYAINYQMDISNGRLDVDKFFTGKQYGDGVRSLDGDIVQLMSINNEVGIESFDLDSSHYYIYNGEIMDPEDPYFSDYFKNTFYGPTPIDFKLDVNGEHKRLCLNNRLGDYSQVVPFYLWDKVGSGFGSYTLGYTDAQKWDRTQISSMKLQRMYSISGVKETNTNYIMSNGEEEYLLMPMTKEHPTYVATDVFEDSLERFDVISYNEPSTSIGSGYNYVEGSLWLHVKSGTVEDPMSGDIYVVVNKTWVKQDGVYYNSTTIFLPQTVVNYRGSKQVLSTPFMFCFGLKSGRSSLDIMVKNFGEKGAFDTVETYDCPQLPQ